MIIREVADAVQRERRAIGPADVLGRDEKLRRDGRAEKAVLSALPLPPAAEQAAARRGGIVRGIAGTMEEHRPRGAGWESQRRREREEKGAREGSRTERGAKSGHVGMA